MVLGLFRSYLKNQATTRIVDSDESVNNAQEDHQESGEFGYVKSSLSEFVHTLKFEHVNCQQTGVSEQIERSEYDLKRSM